MAKISSYQRMKLCYESEIKDLREDIDILIGCDYLKAEEVKMKYAIKKNIEQSIWMGSINNKNTFSGLLPILLSECKVKVQSPLLFLQTGITA
jgi:hypothetical protein